MTTSTDTIDRQRFLPCYRNGGMRPADRLTFRAHSNRASRRRSTPNLGKTFPLWRYGQDLHSGTRAAVGMPFSLTARTAASSVDQNNRVGSLRRSYNRFVRADTAARS